MLKKNDDIKTSKKRVDDLVMKGMQRGMKKDESVEVK